MKQLKIELKKGKSYQNNYSGSGIVVCGVEKESEKIDVRAMQRFKDNNLGLRHVSFKLSGQDVIINAIRFDFER